MKTETTHSERLRELEIKVAFLEKHVEEQDRAMLGYFRQIERLQREIKHVAGTLSAGAAGRENGATDSGERLWENEKPPHY